MQFDSEKLSQTLKTPIKNTDLFITAFTHRSYLNEHPNYPNPSNERLEFLGDAVLQLLSSEYLYDKYKDSPEGDLTNFRAAIVCTPSLAEESKRLGYGQFLLLSNGEEANGGRDREYILANTFEAVLGALYTERGLKFCREFVQRELFYKVEEIVKKERYKDAKSKFQEISQEKYGLTPSYEVIESWGADHEKTFKVGVYLGKNLKGEGTGKSKQKAEQQAAVDALDKI
ncbi:MAG TPA: ribonuclease III [Patescibacteria group bacterium]|nr:ribonuclease III [Patescibacteria group bacterium]